MAYKKIEINENFFLNGIRNSYKFSTVGYTKFSNFKTKENLKKQFREFIIKDKYLKSEYNFERNILLSKIFKDCKYDPRYVTFIYDGLERIYKMFDDYKKLNIPLSAKNMSLEYVFDISAYSKTEKRIFDYITSLLDINCGGIDYLDIKIKDNLRIIKFKNNKSRAYDILLSDIENMLFKFSQKVIEPGK